MSLDEALESLRRVLERVAAAGLKLHPDKCHIMRREVEFIGHKLGKDGIGTLEEKINTIRDWPTPTDQRQLKSFLGLASYYRRFLKGFSCIGAPLFCLQQKEHAFDWTYECQKALMESPILVPPDAPLPFILDTDASNIGMGVVLSQEEPDGERVVAYFSRVFNKSERLYCVARRELLAVVMTVRHFKHYLCGTLFTIRTDHTALQWLMFFSFTFTFMHLADAFIQSDLQCIQVIHFLSVCVPWESNPQPLRC